MSDNWVTKKKQSFIIL